MAAGHPDTLSFARAWADADPDHAGALEALADALAREGAPIALRAYESVVEVRPFSAREHRSLARAFENEGDMDRACSHRRALVSIKPTTNHHAGLIACLERAGRSHDASEAERDALATPEGEHRKLAKALASAAPRSGRRGQLRATLTWSGSDELDVALVDHRGRRISTLHDRGKATARAGRGRDELDLGTVHRAVFVEVSRRKPAGGGDVTRPIPATLELVTPHGRRTVSVSVPVGTTRAAKVFWTR
jgi:tetratricopeptide (TPR) repeat protein